LDTITQLRERLDDVREAGAEVALVGNGSVQAAASFQRDRVPEFSVFTDPSLKTYQELGMRRGVRATLGLSSMIAAGRALLRGRRQTSVQGDPWQQGGTYVVARGGLIVYAKPNRDAGHRPDLEAALAALRAAS